MYKSVFNGVIAIVFIWSNVAILCVLCPSPSGIHDESKLAGQMKLCWRRCGLRFQADDAESTSNEGMSSFEACFERCLSEKGELSAISNDQKALTNKEKTAPFKRTRSDTSSHIASQNSVIKHGYDCYNGSANSSSPAMFASGIKIMFQQLYGTKRFQGKISWKPLQNDGVTWTKYKIISVYMANKHVECTELDKKVTTYAITNSSHGIMNNSVVYVLVTSYPHSNDLANPYSRFLGCKVPNDCQASTTTPPSKAWSDYSKVLSPTSDSDKKGTAIIAAVLSTIVAIVLIGLIVFYCRRRPLPPTLDLEFEYDAFIIFSSEDSQWVINTLIPTLEENHGMKCCVHYRDFTPGVTFRKNMVDSVYKCKKTIAVVSTHFFNSKYCGSELDYALHRLMEKRDDSLVVIKIDDVDRRKLPKELQKRSYIDYAKSVEKESWEKKLVDCLSYK